MRVNERKVLELILLGKDEAIRRKWLRTSKIYAFWKETWKEIKKAKKPEDYMWLVFNALQRVPCMGSLEVEYFKRVLILFLQDKGLESQLI